MAWFALSHYSGLRVQGEGAGSFLDGQLTQKVSDLEPGALRLAAWCNAQGRVRALFNVVRGSDAFWLLLPADLCEATHKRLRMFILRAPVILEPLASDTAVYAGVGSDIALPEGLTELARGQDDHHPLRCLAVAQRRAQQVHELGSFEDWEAEQIRLGLPAVGAACSEHWLPQNLNLEALGGLSYQKGCYPGQEIVARVHYRGTVKQVLARYIVEPAESAPLPQPGSACASDAASIQQPVGEVLRAAHPPGRSPEVLVVAETTHAGSARLWSSGVWLAPAP